MISSRNNNTKLGFTLLELVVVLAGLGILSSLAIPNFIRLLDFNNIDEAKALLNSAAADCLQKSREDNYKIDEEILSNQRLNSIGYKINEDFNDCKAVELLPTSEGDDIRFPIGFEINNGKLRKFASPTSTDAASKSSCENWAGVKCEENQELKELIAYRKEIEAAEKACTDAFTSNTAGDDTDGAFLYWNSNATSGCPTRPPKVVSSTCTTNGCNKKTYFFEGENLRTDDPTAYDKAREAKFGAECIQWQAQQRAKQITTEPGTFSTFASCQGGKQQFWFCNGEDMKSEEEHKNCINAQRSQFCIDEITSKKAESKSGSFKGKFSAGQAGWPDPCAKPIWLCQGETFDESSYATSLCATPPSPPKCVPYNGDPMYCAWGGSWKTKPRCLQFCL